MYHQYMKKIYILIFFVVFFGFICSLPSYAIFDQGTQFPGVSCGVAGGTKSQFFNDDPSKCCTYKVNALYHLPAGGEKIPAVGGIIKIFNDKADAIENIQKDLNGEPCVFGIPVQTGSSCTCKEDPNATASANAIQRLRLMCASYIKEGVELQNCISCVMGKGGMYTGMGCVPLNVQEFIGTFIFSWGLGFAGGIALLCIIYSAFRMQTSMGNPEAIKKAQENLTACITGLILILFSVFILRLIGVTILKIPFLK